MTEKSHATLFLAAVGTGIGVFAGLAWLNRGHASAATMPVVGPTSRPPTGGNLVPLQDPRMSLVNTNDPAKDRLVTTVLSVQLDALRAPPQPTVVIRATAYLASKGSPAPVATFRSPADALYWAALKVNQSVLRQFYGGGR